MAYFAGLDLSVKETSVCIVDDTHHRREPRPEATVQHADLQAIHRYQCV